MQMKQYINELKKQPENADKLWEAYMVAPYWDELSKYAPFDLSARKPEAMKDIDVLERQYEILCGLDVIKMEEEFNRIATILPNYDDDPITVAIYPLSDDNKDVKDKQNGVIGTSLFGNLLIMVNPLADHYKEWIPYVFAHEYHHTVWGNYWFVKHGDALEHKFIDSLVIDGEADSFALSMYPNLQPEWIFGLEKETVKQLWENTYLDIVEEKDVDYCKYMFGAEEDDIPWCAGYAVGYQIIQKYLASHKELSFRDLIEVKPDIMLKEK